MILFIALMIEFHRHYTRPSRRAGRPGGPVAASLVLACGLALILFLSAIVAMRVARIGSLVDEGREVAASVRKVQHFAVRGRGWSWNSSWTASRRLQP